MILCDDVRVDPDNPKKVNIFGLVSSIKVECDVFPIVHPEICVYLHLTEGRGSGEAQIAIVRADSGEASFVGSPHMLTFPSNPLAVKGVAFRILDCVLPEAGLYWVEFRYGGKALARQPLLVRSSP
jgi:hypothetical protein